MNRRILSLLLALVLLIPVFALSQDNVVEARRHKVKVLAEYLHDTKSYTQGLFFYDGHLWETTGQYGESCLNKLDLKTGKWKRKWKFIRNTKYAVRKTLSSAAETFTWFIVQKD